jgi:WD40 repeat protein
VFAVAEPIRVPERFGDDTDCLALSPSGARLAIYAREWPGFSAEVLSIYATADGRLLAGPEAVGDCRAAHFLDEATLVLACGFHCLSWHLPGRPKRLLSSPGRFVTALAVHPGSSAFAVATKTNGNGAAVCDLASGKRRLALPLPWPYELSARAFTFSQDGRLLAAVLQPFKGDDEGILVWDLTTARRLRLHLPERYVCAMCFAEGGEELYAAFDRTVEVYAAGQLEPVRSLALPKKMNGLLPVTNLTPDGSAVEVMDYRGHWARLDAATGRVLRQAGPPVELAEDYRREALSADGRVAAAVARDRTVAVWRVGE